MTDEEDQLRAIMADLLTRTANALRGDPPPLTSWSWHDLPERAAAAIAAIGVPTLGTGACSWTSGLDDFDTLMR